MPKERSYIAIDLKSFYASYECVSRHLDPLGVNLVVADESRTEKTICLAVSPALKSYGIPGRARLFEVLQKVKEANALRREKAPGKVFTGKSYDAAALNNDPSLEIDFLIAKPRMGQYMECSNHIYEIYLKYVSPEDIHVYSVDEVFIDATPYLKTYGLTARELAQTMIEDVFRNTGITATAGIGTNLYLCKVAMDIVAKHITPDNNGVRIAELDELSYRRLLWDHKPITDFWRVGRGYAQSLEKVGITTMGQIARCSLGKPGEFYSEDLLYKLFGKNAELLIDHAWGWEPVTIAHIRAYRPSSNSISSGQVLQEPYPYEKTRIIVREMVESLVLELVEKGLSTDQIVLTLGYDRENMTNPEIARRYAGAVSTDHYGRKIPKHAHGTGNLPRRCSSTRLIMETTMALFERIADPLLLVRRVNLTANRILPEDAVASDLDFQQMDLFKDTQESEMEESLLAREKRQQQAILYIRGKYGKNALLKGVNYQEGATMIDRNGQIGGHKA